MRQVRRNVFETNSSSCHSLTLIKGGDLQSSCLEVSDEDLIKIHGGEFGWEVEQYTGQESKLQYLFTGIRYQNEANDIINSIWFKWLNEMIFEYTGHELHPIEKDSWCEWGYIDHQSIGELDEIFIKDEQTFKENAKWFIFGSESYFITDNDNH